MTNWVRSQLECSTISLGFCKTAISAGFFTLSVAFLSCTIENLAREKQSEYDPYHCSYPFVYNPKSIVASIVSWNLCAFTNKVKIQETLIE